MPMHIAVSASTEERQKSGRSRGRVVYIPVHTSMYLYILVCTVLYLTYCMMHSLAPYYLLVVCSFILTFSSPAYSSFKTRISPQIWLCPSGIGIHSSIYQYIQVHTYTYQYVPVCTSIYQYIMVHTTNIYIVIPVLRGWGVCRTLLL